MKKLFFKTILLSPVHCDLRFAPLRVIPKRQWDKVGIGALPEEVVAAAVIGGAKEGRAIKVDNHLN